MEASTDSALVSSARASAILELGRLQQALFHAHLAFRAAPDQAPAERLESVQANLR